MDAFLGILLLLSALVGALKGPHRILGGWLGWILAVPILARLQPWALNIVESDSGLLFFIKYAWWPLGFLIFSALGSLAGQFMDDALARSHSRWMVLLLGAFLSMIMTVAGCFLSIVFLYPMVSRIQISAFQNSDFVRLAGEFREANPNLDQTLSEWSGLSPVLKRLELNHGSIPKELPEP